MTLLVWGGIAAGACPTARAQDGLPDPLPQAAASASQPPGPTASASPAPVSVEQLAERLRVMEEMNRKLVEQLEAANRAHDEQMQQLLAKFGELSTRLDVNATGAPTATGSVRAMSRPTVAPSNDPPSAFPDTPVPDYNEEQFYPSTPAPGYPRMDAASALGPKLMWQTDDEEIQFRVHLESQFDTRIWGQRDQVPANSGFFLPRQRVFFDGNITKKIEYELSINRGLGGQVNILNAFINLHFDDRFQLRFGRYFTPLMYDQYAISNYWMPTPERSLFTTNVGLGRQIGIMGWGYLVRQATRLRGWRIQRFAELVREPHQRSRFRRLSQWQAVSASRKRCHSPSF